MAAILRVHGPVDDAGVKRDRTPAVPARPSARGILVRLRRAHLRVLKLAHARRPTSRKGRCACLAKAEKSASCRSIPSRARACARTRKRRAPAWWMVKRARTSSWSNRGNQYGTDSMRKMFKATLLAAGVDTGIHPARRAPHVRKRPVGRRRRPAQRPGDAWSRQPFDHPDLHARPPSTAWQTCTAKRIREDRQSRQALPSGNLILPSNHA